MANKHTVLKSVEDLPKEEGVYLCARAEDVPDFFGDSLYGVCSECGERVIYRPHGPTHLTKVCLPCALPELAKLSAEGELNVFTTEKVVQEVELLCAKADGKAN